MRNFLTSPYLVAMAINILAYFVIWGIKLLLSTHISRYIKDTRKHWDELVAFTAERTTQSFMLISAMYIGFKYLKHSPQIDSYANRVFFIMAMYQIAVWSHHLLEKWITSTIRKRTEKNPAAATSIGLIKLFSQMILFSIISLFTLSNLGIKITTIIAGLGVGGIAVALALQKILGDLFSSLSIVLDRPFVVGDFIIIDQYMGEVEKIGLKTTRIRSLGGEQIIFSNSDVLAARIRNMKRLQERRISFMLNLPLGSSSEKIRTAVSLISAIIRTKRQIRFERCHFMRIGNTFDIETVYWVLNDNYDLHMDIQQEILLDIKNSLEAEDINFAYPATEILVRSNLTPLQ